MNLTEEIVYCIAGDGTPFKDITFKDDEGNVVGTSTLDASNPSVVTEAEYDLAVADRAAAKKVISDQMDADHAQAQEDAYNDLVANGVAAATATLLTGHTP